MTTPFVYVLMSGDIVIRDEEDGRLCVYSEIADAIRDQNNIRATIPNVQMVRTRLMELDLVNVAQPAIAGLKVPGAAPVIPPFDGLNFAGLAPRPLIEERKALNP